MAKPKQTIETTETVVRLPLNQLKESTLNPRLHFDPVGLQELAQSIKENGILEPILVRQNCEGFEIIAGHRRTRASELAGVPDIPAIIKTASDETVLEWQIIENLQRADVSYWEEANAIKKLRDQASLDVNEIAKKIGKHKSYIYAMLLITQVPEEVGKAFAAQQITKSVALLIASLRTAEQQIEVTNALKRERLDRRISRYQAQVFIQKKYSNKERARTEKKSAFQKAGVDYVANWKHYLVQFSCAQFEQFKSIVRGRTETSVLAEAVEAVMKGSE